MKQRITVTNKAQLIAAVGCAIDFLGITEITLIRKINKTFYKLSPSQHEIERGRPESFNRFLKKVRSAIRRTPAIHFKS